MDVRENAGRLGVRQNAEGCKLQAFSSTANVTDMAHKLCVVSEVNIGRMIPLSRQDWSSGSCNQFSSENDPVPGRVLGRVSALFS